MKICMMASLVAQSLKNLPAVWETWVWSLCWEDPLVEGMQLSPVFLPGESPWTEEPAGLQSLRSQRVRHDWVTKPRHIKWTNRFQINMHKISTIWFYCKCMYACRKIWNYNSKNDSRPAYKRKPPHSDSKQAQALGPLQQESGKGVLREKDWTWRLESYVTYFLCHDLNFISFPLVSIFTFESTIF